jgi:hypothetical protein
MACLSRQLAVGPPFHLGPMATWSFRPRNRQATLKPFDDKDFAMRLIAGLALVWVAAVLAGCQSGRTSCARGDWCACSNGTDCYQGCVDGDGCRFFCSYMDHCGSVCGNDCNLDCHDATDCSAECGDSCNITCSNSVSCGSFCGANCNYSCWETERCGVRAGAGSTISCSSAKSCVVECLGPCQVFCTDQVDHCEVSCPQGLSPVSCDNGMVACGSC